MSNIHIAVSGADAAVTRPATLTAGMVGAAVTFSFSGEAWAALEKIAVFRAGNVRRDVTAWENGTCAIPWECLRMPGEHLLAGVYGADGDGTVVIPTVYADCGVIQPGADPTGDPAADPDTPFFTPMLERALAEAKASGLFDGAAGPAGAPGAKGDKGEKGDAFAYADFTAAQLAALKGDRGEKGKRATKGTPARKAPPVTATPCWDCTPRWRPCRPPIPPAAPDRRGSWARRTATPCTSGTWTRPHGST